MKALSRILVVSAMLAVMLVPLATMSDQLAAPLIKTVNPPQEKVRYADQTLRFITDVPLKVKLSVQEPGKVHLQFVAHPNYPGGSGPAWTVQIVWEDWHKEIYNGPPPTPEPEDVILLTESGFTEK
jgi:hypothetical protein